MGYVTNDILLGEVFEAWVSMSYPLYVPRSISEVWTSEFLDFLNEIHEVSAQDMLLGFLLKCKKMNRQSPLTCRMILIRIHRGMKSSILC